MQKESDHVSSDADQPALQSARFFEHHTMTHLNKIIKILRTAQKKDRYIISHLYGKSPEHLSELEEIELCDLIDKRSK